MKWCSCCCFSYEPNTLSDAEEALLELDLQLQIVEIIVADISTFEKDASYDRIHCIGMFEHMKNYSDLLNKISKWMKQDSLLFIIRYFFIGGAMPSANLLLYFQDGVSVADHWLEWLKRMDQYLASIKPIKDSTYGKDQAVKWTFYRRTFFIAVAELFA
uniref:Methyltransferase type 11 domain-containing protein n=1 Tax=Populus trichocarpa TaxID=3694 RepID=U5GC11_POPTR